MTTFFIENFVVNASGNLGADTVNGAAGDDARSSGMPTHRSATDGYDIVDGGTEGAAGDHVRHQRRMLRRSSSAIYTRAAFAAAGQQS